MWCGDHLDKDDGREVNALRCETDTVPARCGR